MINEQLKVKYKVSFPSGDVDDSYALQLCQSVWTLFLDGKCGTSPSGYSEWELWRQYGAGAEPADIYKAWVKNSKMFPREVQELANQYNLDAKATAAFLRKGFKAVNFTPISIIPGIKARIRGELEDIDFNVKVSAIDPFSKNAEEDEKWQTWFESVEREFMEKMARAMGLEPNDMRISVSSLEELELIEGAEGFKSNWAILAEKLIRFTHDVSGYKEERMMWVDDLIDGGMAVSMDTYEDGVVKHKYVNPATFVIQHSERSDYADAQYAGHLEFVPISSLRGKVDPQKVGGVLRRYSGIYGMPPSEGHVNVADDNNQLGAISGKVLVMNLSFIADEYDYYREFSYKGRKKIRPISKEEAERFKDGVSAEPRRMLFSVKWVVGTDVVYDVGPVYNQPKDKLGNVRLNYHVYSLPYKSIVRQLIPLQEEYMKGWILYQNGVNNGFKSGVALNMTMLKNVTLQGGKAASPTEILEFYKEEGILPYGYSFTGEYKGGAAVPATPMQGVVEMVINEAVRRRDYVRSAVYDLLGINIMQTNLPNTGVSELGNEEVLYKSLQSAVKPIVHATLRIKESIAKNVMTRIQNCIAYDKSFAERYSGVLSRNDVELLRIAEKEGANYMVSMVAKPSYDYVSTLLGTIQSAYASGLVDPHDFLFVMEQLLNDVEVGRIRQYISYKIEKTRQRNEQMRLAAIDRQNQGLAEVNNMNMQGQFALLEKKIEGKLAEVAQKYQGELVKEREITNREIEKTVRKIMAK